jgi:ATP-binding cassette subfamily B protein/subfamily B ATP-binding cassette protein MsbA
MGTEPTNSTGEPNRAGAKAPSSSKLRHLEFRRTGVATAPSDNGQAPEKPKREPEKRRRYLRDYRAWLWPYRWALGAIFVMALVTASLDMVWPVLLKRVVDMLPRDLSYAEKARELRWFGLSIIAVLLVKQGLEALRSWRLTVLNARLVFTLRKRLFEKLLGLSLGELSDMKAGGITSRLSGDVDSVSGLVNLAVINPAVALVRIVLTIAIVLYLSPPLAVASLVLLPPLALASYLWLKKVRPIYRSMREDRSAIDARVTETFGGIRVVRSFRREPREERNYAVGHHTVIRKSLWAEWVELALATVWGLLIPGISVVITWYGGWLYLKNKTSLGDIFAFQIYAVLLIQPVWQIVSSVSQTQRSLAAMERVFDVLARQPDKPDAPGAIDAPSPVREFRFDHVTFEYRAGIPVVRDFDLSVPGGATVALVGPSGAGKTTITDLVARFYDPTSGSIQLNGVDLRQMRLGSYRRMLAVVQQDVFLFDGTVRQNIEYGLRGASDERILDAARRANADEFIQRLPEGYDTLIGERGFKLSGGQRQRLSIARAILANPQILILDEATSNLDTESEQLIQQSLAELFQGRTTFVIAHRLSTITHADLIVVMDGGRIVETGKHEELMSKRGLYYDMVERQRRSMNVNGELVVDLQEANSPSPLAGRG